MCDRGLETQIWGWLNDKTTGHYIFNNNHQFQKETNNIMSGWTKMQKLAAVAVGAAGGVAVFLSMNRHRSTQVLNSWTTNTVVPAEAVWDFNWDQ